MPPRDGRVWPEVIGEHLRGLATVVSAVVVVDEAEASDVVVGKLVRVQPEFFRFFVGRQFEARLESPKNNACVICILA